MSVGLGMVRDVGSEYVLSVIEKYAVGVGTASAAGRAANELVPVLREWAGRYLLDIGLSGSYAKGTAIALGTDVDVFISLGDVAGRSMKDIYWSLLQFLADRGLGPRRQTHSPPRHAAYRCNRSPPLLRFADQADFDGQGNFLRGNAKKSPWEDFLQNIVGPDTR